MSYDRRKIEADIGALLHTYIGDRSPEHPEGANCHGCIGMADSLIEDVHRQLDVEFMARIDRICDEPDIGMCDMVEVSVVGTVLKLDERFGLPVAVIAVGPFEHSEQQTVVVRTDRLRLVQRFEQ